MLSTEEQREMDMLKAVNEGLQLQIRQRDAESELMREALLQIESSTRIPREYQPSYYTLNHIARRGIGLDES